MSMVALAMMPRPPASAVDDVRCAPGDPAHAGLHDRVLDADEVTQAGVQAWVQARDRVSHGLH